MLHRLHTRHAPHAAPAWRTSLQQLMHPPSMTNSPRSRVARAQNHLRAAQRSKNDVPQHGYQAMRSHLVCMQRQWWVLSTWLGHNCYSRCSVLHSRCPALHSRREQSQHTASTATEPPPPPQASLIHCAWHLLHTLVCRQSRRFGFR